jgi:hypothetical protein
MFLNNFEEAWEPYEIQSVFPRKNLVFKCYKEKENWNFFAENIFFKSTIYLCDVNKYSFVNNYNSWKSMNL